MLRRIFDLKREEGTGNWRKMRNDEHYTLYSEKMLLRTSN
jgi:hypothetical protein